MKSKSRGPKHITTKHALYALFIGTSLIMVWRGVWGLLDMYFFPNDPAVSFSLSVIIGILILLATGKMVKELT